MSDEKEIATVTLKDIDGTAGREVKVKIIEGLGALCFRFEGYGDAIEDDGGIPLLLEVYDGELRVIAWADINEDEPSHSISLEGARIELRKP